MGDKLFLADTGRDQREAVGFRGKYACHDAGSDIPERATGGRIMRFDRRQRETGSVERRFWECSACVSVCLSVCLTV